MPPLNVSPVMGRILSACFPALPDIEAVAAATALAADQAVARGAAPLIAVHVGIEIERLLYAHLPH